jgi:hypothetical protein
MLKFEETYTIVVVDGEATKLFEHGQASEEATSKH